MHSRHGSWVTTVAQVVADAGDRSQQLALESLQRENRVLLKSLAKAQQRSTDFCQQHAQHHEQAQSLMLRLRGELVCKDTRIAALEEQVKALQEHCHQLERLKQQSAQEVERLRQLMGPESEPWTDKAVGEIVGAPDLGDRAVLCVGGKTAVISVYRQLIEQFGGRFLHHDGEDEHNPTRLDTTLAAADLVICQTGCIGHYAYWRVKSHCKRTGKECVYVDNPSAHAMLKGLTQVSAGWHKVTHQPTE